MSDAPIKGLTLVVGPANSGKLGRVLGWWQERLASQPLIVVPTSPDARSLSAEMAQRRGALVGQSPAITFDGLLRLLLKRSPRYTGDFERELLVSYLLREEPPRSPGFSARFPGTATAAASLLQQLGDSGRSAEEIFGLLAGWASVDAESTALAADISRLLTGYSALRDHLGLCDRSGAICEALAAVQWFTRPLALYGFTSFTFAQQRLIKALAEVTEVLLALDDDPEGGWGLTTATELAYWEKLAGPSVEKFPWKSDYMSPAVAFLERHFTDDDPPEEPPTPAWAGNDGGGVRFLLASGQRNEAELAAQEVARLVRYGLRPGDIGVIVRSMEPWGRLLGEVFASCGVPCEIEHMQALGDTGLGHALLGGLRGMVADDAAPVIDYLRGPFSALTLEQVADVELDYLRGTGRGVEALAQCAGATAREAIRRLARAVVRRDGAAFIDLDAAQELNLHMLENSLQDFATVAGDPARSAAARADAGSDTRAARVVTEALDELALFRDDRRLPEEVLRAEVLLPALAGLRVPAGPSGSAGAVQVLTAHRARARRFQAVLILGLVEGEFPRRGDHPALLTAAQRARLETVGGALFPPEVDEEEALFVRAISRSSKLLLLSARDADDGGGFAGQSYYWSHCKAMLQVGDHDVLRRTLADQVYPPQLAPSMRHYLRTCAAGGLVPHESCGVDFFRPPGWRSRSGLAGLASEQVLQELAATASFSPSALESYLRCPFSWFVERVVGAEDMETLADNRLAGDLLHRVMRDSFRQLKIEEALPLRADGLQRANDLAAGIISDLVQSDECPGTAADRRILEWRVRRWAAEVFAMEVEAASLLQPLETECELGADGGVDVDGLTLRGRIDRIDHSPAGDIFIVDYKSGRLAPKSKIGTEEALQLPLYMLALHKERGDVKVLGGAYLSPKERKRSGVAAAGCEHLLAGQTAGCTIVDQDALRGLLDQSLALAKKAAEGIRAGDIAPLPGRKCPGWCRLGTVCRARRGTARW